MVTVCGVVNEPTDAVIMSVPAQPLSRYEPTATPFTVVTLAVSTALLLAAQLEVNVTTCGEVTGTPPLLTVTLTLVVPNAESGAADVLPVPSVIADRVSEDEPIEIPIEPVTSAESTWAVAVIVVAPEAEILAGSNLTISVTPEALVRAVPGDIVISVESVVNVTTVFGTAAPVASLRVAITVP